MPAKRRAKTAGGGRLGNNLNAELGDARRRQSFAEGDVQVFFRPDHIVGHLRRKILSARYVVACVAWCSNPTLLDALRRCKGVSLVVQYDRALLRKHREELTQLTPMPGAKSAVSFVRGKGRCLMHHKFAVYLDDHRRPTSVTTGSFNWTKNSTKNAEHLVEVRTPAVAARFMQEHLQVLGISTPLRKPRRKKNKTSAVL